MDTFSSSTFLLSCSGWSSQYDWKSQVQPKIDWWRVRNLGTQGRMHSLKRKGFSTSLLFFINHLALFSIVSVICLSGCALCCFLPPSRSLWRCFSDHFDAVLLQLRSEQCVLILQLFNLKKKQRIFFLASSTFTAAKKEKKRNCFKFTEQTFFEKWESWVSHVHAGLCNPQDYRLVCAALVKDTPVHNQLDYQILRYVISATFPLGESWIHCLPTVGPRKDIKLWAPE